jgi:hypothetical protein
MKNGITVTIPAVALAAFTLWAASRPPDIPFEKHTIDLGASETCAVADFNGDGRLDIVSGENWFEAPHWTPRRFRELNFSGNYIDNFSDLPLDVNGDGRTDVISVAWFSRRMAWFENSGNAAGNWKEHPIESGPPHEFAFLVDLDNDGKAREILPQFGDEKAPLAWYALAASGKFEKRVVSDRSYGHGIGAGDINGDKRNDVLTPKGWFEAPGWTFHPGFPESGALSFMHVMDVNGDGRNDVVTSHAHDYGVFWFEQGEGGKWTRRMIDDSWSQAHALSLVDLNRDGRLDIVTGKRYMAHNGRDPGEKEPLGIYWYEQLWSPDKSKFEWVRHLVDYGTRAGGGMQIPVLDLDGDGDLDFAVGGKSGLFLFENRSASRPSSSGARRR